MDITALKTMMEIQALQTIGTSDANSALSSNGSVFSELIEDMLEDASSSLNEAYNQLGSSNTAASSSTTEPFLAAFLHPSASTIQQSMQAQQPTTPSAFTDGILNGLTNFDNVLHGAEQYASIIKKAAATYNLPEKLIASVIKQESNFNPNAKSHAGATGLMQLMPATAKYLGVQDATNPEQNIMGGAKYLRQMLDQFDNNISTALAAYNAVPGNVRKYIRIPPFKETTNYVQKVMNYYQV